MHLNVSLQLQERLMNVVLKNEGLANKDLAKFESQIHNLADKWDRDDVDL